MTPALELLFPSQNFCGCLSRLQGRRDSQRRVWKMSAAVLRRGSWSVLKSRLPAEEAVWVVPFFGLIEVQAFVPAAFGFSCIHGGSKAGNDRCESGDAHIGQQAREQKRRSAKGLFEIRLPAAVELPRSKLAEDDVPVFGCRENAVPVDGCAGGDQRQLP